MTHFIRFPDKKTGMAALEAADLLTKNGDYITATHTHALDVIGEIRIGGQWDIETGEELAAPQLLPGWHVNYIGELPNGWEEYIVTPQNPIRVWL